MKSQERRHRNCAHNVEHVPNRLPYSSSDVPTDLDLAPRRVTTLLVVQDESPTYLCSLGSENPAEWSGTICDRDSFSDGCPYFVPRVSAEAATAEFRELLLDDGYVYEHYRDVAALQWVVEDRRPRPPWYVRLLRRLGLMRELSPLPASLPPGASEEVDRELENIWR